MAGGLLLRGDMVTAPLFARVDLVLERLRVALAAVAGTAAATQPQRASTGERLRPVQFIGVIPADVVEELAR